MAKCENKERAEQAMYSMALETFALPGDDAFPLNAFFKKPEGREKEDMKKYMTQLRQETGMRLVDRVFDPNLSVEVKPNHSNSQID